MESPFLVLNGDVLSNINFSNLMQFHEEQDFASATICVREYLVDIPFGVVTANNSQLIELVEKPQYKHLINHASHKIKLITNSPNTYVYRIEILTKNKKLYFYEWHVQKGSDESCEGCWFTSAVSQPVDQGNTI